MSHIKISLLLLFSALSSQAIFCSQNSMTMSVFLQDEIEDAREKLKRQVMPDVQKELRNQALASAIKLAEHKKNKAAQEIMEKKKTDAREQYLQQIPAPVKANYIPTLKKINPDSAKNLKKVTGKATESTNGVRDAKRLSDAKTYYLDVQKARRKLYLQTILDSAEPIDPTPGKITVTKSTDLEGIITCTRAFDKNDRFGF